MLYSDSLAFQRKQLNNAIDECYSLISNLPNAYEQFVFDERSVWEAMQMQLVRQFILGFAEFETPDSKNGVEESIHVLLGFDELIKTLYHDAGENKKADLNFFFSEIERSTNKLKQYSKGSVDYFQFYSEYYNDLSGSLSKLRDIMLSEKNQYFTTAINFQNRSIFDPHAFNSYFFLPGKTHANQKEVAELGRILFFDPALSANSLRACASCHQPEKAFTDGLPLSQSFEPGKFLTRNAPTIINSVLQRRLFHDGRAFSFEDQAGRVMSNPLEMHNDFQTVASKLVHSAEYRKRFRSAFEGTEDTSITGRSVLIAIAEYERTLIGMNTRFDKAISNRENDLSNDEIAGFNIFMGKAACGSCHFLPLFNSLVPPVYVETEWEVIGVPSAKLSNPRELDGDIGRYEIIPVDIFKNAFKTPGLRNIALTAPYMHNGVFKSLDEVIDFYDRGGGKGLGITVENQTLSDEPLNLTPTEKFQLKVFLESLNDTITLNEIPVKLPEFEDNELLNRRKVGGEY
jgi:cytochrome c peroxidase